MSDLNAFWGDIAIAALPILVTYLMACALLHQDPFYIHHLLNAGVQVWNLLRLVFK